jgi:nicotinamide riboside transporter PnuC
VNKKKKENIITCPIKEDGKLFENRIRGAQLAKRVSYAYLIFAIILLIAGLVLKGGEVLLFSGIFYIIMFIAVYLLSTKYSEYKYAWILLIICAVISIIITRGMLAIAFAILLLICANDMRKELDN